MFKLKILLITLLACCVILASGQGLSKKELKVAGKPGASVALFLKQNTSGGWGIIVKTAGGTWLTQENPARINIFGETAQPDIYTAGYKKIIRDANGFTGLATVSPAKGVVFHFTDHWTMENQLIHLERTVQISGNLNKGFTSSLSLETGKEYAWSDLRYFIPSVVYGYAGNISNAHPGVLEVRESDMTAPIAGIYFNNGISATLLNPLSKAGSNEDANTGEMEIHEQPKGGVALAYNLPWGFGTNKTKSTHPVTNGFKQSYQLTLRLGRDEKFRDYYNQAWRLAWAKLNPKIYYHNIEVVRRSLTDMLADRVETIDGRTGIPNFFNWTSRPANAPSNWQTTITHNGGAIMGFTGKNIEAAVFLIMDAERGQSPLDNQHRQKGLDIISSFLKLKMNPPIAEGFNLSTGAPMQAIPLNRGFPPQVYLRSFGDDLKILLRGYMFEKQHGHDHPEWLNWCKSFADWLLTQQYPDGGFPRSWVPGTGEVRIAAPQSSYNAVPMLVLLSQITGDPKYKQSAGRAAEFCWSKYQVDDYYVGGTIDNPNVQDKEAATLSVEAYLALYEDSHDTKWLNRAKAAANNAETYIYIWEHEDGVPSIGTNKVVAYVGSGVDMYMAFDVDEYAKLYKYTGDRHYYEVAKLLLHNTKAVMGIPGRTFDLPGIGWQTEDARYPTKGKRGKLWLPWVTTEHLNGILLLEQFDPMLFKQLCSQ